MSDLSIIEFGVYGFITYTGLLMLIISSVRESPMERTRSDTIVKAMFLLPSLICAPVLATSGVHITIQHTNDIIKDLNNSRTWSDIADNQFTLVNPIWLSVHMMIFFILLIYIVKQFLLLLMAKE